MGNHVRGTTLSRPDNSNAGSSTNVARIVTLSLDDGYQLDSEVAKLLLKYKLKATFYVLPPSIRPDTLGESEIRYLSRCFEIGAHTVNHVNLPTVTAKQARSEIMNSRRILEEIIGSRVPMFCYPNGEYNRDTIAMVRDVGFIGARIATQLRVENPIDPYRFATTLHIFPPMRVKKFALKWLAHMMQHFDFQGLLHFCENGLPKSWLALARYFFDYVYEYGGVFHVYGHSWEIEQFEFWGEFEELLQYISERESIKYMTNGEVIRAIFGETLRSNDNPGNKS
jgi:peptidoglycan/xylan/chitin deacetylase (PgdA/CDA1 family)